MEERSNYHTILKIIAMLKTVPTKTGKGMNKRQIENVLKVMKK